MNQDPLAYRHPRTLDEAFGNGQCTSFDDVDDYSATEVIVYAVCIFGLAWLALILIVWG